MKKEFLELMKCPYCGTDFKIDNIYDEKEDEIITGTIRCECNEYPVLSSILYLKMGATKEYILNCLRAGKARRATATSLLKGIDDILRVAAFLGTKGLFGRQLKRFLLALLGIAANRSYRKYANSNLPFFDVLGNSGYETYLKHRFSAESLWSVYPFVPLLKENKGRILDLCCGTGHASFIISQYVSPEELVCVDHTFSSLYLNKKYFAKDAQFICLDANYPLPFKQNTFGSVLMLDAFHYIHARALLARQMEHVLSSDGLLLLLHLHIPSSPNITAGEPLSPEVWANLFQKIKIKALPESTVVEHFLLEGRLDLATEYSDDELSSSTALIIVGNKGDSISRIFERVWDALLNNKSHLIISPIYKIKRERNSAILDRGSPSNSFWEEFPLAQRHLPQRYVIGGELGKIIQGRALKSMLESIPPEDLKHIEDLMKRFVIINVPPEYL